MTKQTSHRGADFFINSPDNQVSEKICSGQPGRSDPLDFHASLSEYKPTPLVKLDSLATRLGLDSLYIKDESKRFGLNAFKGLGASFAINQVIKDSPAIETFCTATDGNHGKAVAWSARKLGKKSVIFVPQGTTSARVRSIENEGARVEIVEGNYDETCDHAVKASRKNRWTLVQDTSREGYEEIPALIMEGYTTMFREIESTIHGDSSPDIDIVVLQAGVGSFAASAIWYYLNRYGDQRPKIVVVEPLEADGILESLKQGFRLSPVGKQNSIMAGLNCGIPSKNAWDIICSGTDAAIRIDDSDAVEAMKMLNFPSGNDDRVISGESGSAGMAGLVKIIKDENMHTLKEHLGINETTRALLFNTEGATDPELFNNLINS